MRKICYALSMTGLLLAATTASAQVQPGAPGAPAPTVPVPPAQPTTPTPPVAAPAPAAQPAPPALSTAPVPPPAPPTESVPYGAGMKVNISPDGSKYLRFLTWSQIWTRYTENNSNTLRAPGKLQSDQVDFAVRRARLIVLAQLNSRFLIYTHIGINNQTGVSGGFAPATDGKKPQVFIHEAVVEYKLNKYVSLGAGLHYQNGLSRLTRSSTLNFLTMDAPLTNWTTIDAIDQFARGIGAYAKGRAGKLDYVFSVNESLLTNQTGAFSSPVGLGATSTTAGVTTNTGSNTAQYNPQGTNHIYQGYVSYELFDQESNLLPFNVGTYLGTKRVLNFGGGFFYNKDGMVSRSSGSVLDAATIAGAGANTPAGLNAYSTIGTQKHDIGNWSLDAFFDTPINKETGTAFTIYGVYYNFDMGPNHVRFIGASNPGYGTDARRGNAVPQSGTGQVGFVETGFLLPKNLLGPKLRVQPYASYLLAGYEGLKKANGNQQNVNIFDGGANFYLDGHNAKFTINYRARPDFTNIEDLKYRPEITLQTQVFL